MTDKVDILLSEWRSGSFVWGKTDCLLSVGDYIALHGGLDVASRFKNTYNDERGALAHMQSNGGSTGLVDQTGLAERLERPVLRGDILVVGLAGFEIPGVCTGRGVALRRERGMSEINLYFVKIIKAWKLP